MGTILTIMANFKNSFKTHGKSLSESKRASLHRQSVIEELTLMERCAHCYLTKKAHDLVGPWLEGKHPWEDVSLVELVKSNESDSNNSFDCNHSEQEKFLCPTPNLVNSIFGKHSLPYYLQATECLVCSDNWEDCRCICTICEKDNCLNTLIPGYHDRVTEDTSSRESDQGFEGAPSLTNSESESESLAMDKNNNYSSS